MSRRTPNPTIAEEAYLKHNATLLLFLGHYFGGGAFNSPLYSTVKEIPILLFSVTVLMIIIFLGIFISLFKTMSTTFKLSSTLFWTGTFKDEFCAHTNNIGLKWSFNIVLYPLLICYFFGLPSTLNTEQMAGFLIGVIALSYSIPVLYL